MVLNRFSRVWVILFMLPTIFFFIRLATFKRIEIFCGAFLIDIQHRSENALIFLSNLDPIGFHEWNCFPGYLALKDLSAKLLNLLEQFRSILKSISFLLRLCIHLAIVIRSKEPILIRNAFQQPIRPQPKSLCGVSALLNI